ncbi:MAG: hypothetical protein HY013_17390, partial [Candidatus Solibacter usitatus]|nr:hypothetical protein [Candidatus Solibacter usitatus]
MTLTLATALWYLSIAARMGVVWRVFSAGLYRVYPWFLAVWCFSVLRALLLAPFSNGSLAYLSIWVWTEPLVLLGDVLVVSEIYALVLRPHRGICTIGRWFLYVAVGLAAVLAVLLTASPASARSRFPELIVRDILLRMDRGVSVALAL